MISFRREHGRSYVYLFGKRAFVISDGGITLAPDVHKFVDWTEIRNRPASELEIVHELATGAVNGVNVEFTSSQPFATVYINGLKQLEGPHYTKINETTLQLSDAPLVGDIVTTSFII